MAPTAWPPLTADSFVHPYRDRQGELGRQEKTTIALLSDLIVIPALVASAQRISIARSMRRRTG